MSRPLATTSTTLDPDRTERLATLEDVVARGLKRFVEVGEALLEIRDSRLYLLTHDSFEDYLEQRWSISRGHAYRLIDGARVAEIVSPEGDIPNERQARELVPLLREDESQVIEVVRELRAEFGDGAATAQQIKTVVGKRLARAKRERARTENAASVRADMPALPADVDLREGPFQEVLADIRDVDLIFTDPPYPREFLPLWSDLGAWAAQALKPGAMLVAYSGHYHLPEVMARIGEHLEYVWCVALSQPGEHTIVHPRRIHVRWKPILLYSRGPYRPSYWIEDLQVAGARTEESDALHEWQQDPNAPRYLIERLTDPGDLVADPFLGSGTFAQVAHELGRSVIGAEIDPVAYATSVDRVAG